MLKDKIKNLINIIENTEIEEIEVSSFWGAQKIRLSKAAKKNSSNLVSYIPNDSDVNKVEIPTKAEEKETSFPKSPENNNTIKSSKEIIEKDLILHEVKAPLVGTYYSSPKPSSPAFINVGDKVKKGDTICIIEAMKIFNEIESDISGTIVEICVENGNPVEFDQSIIKVSID